MSDLRRVPGLILAALLPVLLTACGGGSSGDASSTAAEETVFTLSGIVTPARGSDYDSDVQPRVGNIRLDLSAKDLNNPVTLGGYLSANAGLYVASPDDVPVDYDADLSDHYSLSLVATQQIRLSLFFADQRPGSQSISARLSLRSADEPEVEVQGFTLAGETTQSLIVAQSGETIIRVSTQAPSSPLLYTLTVSEQLSSSSAARHPASMNSDFVAGEVIVALRDRSESSVVSGVIPGAVSGVVSGSVSGIVSRAQQQTRQRQNLAQRHALRPQGSIGRGAELYRLEAAVQVPSARSSQQGQQGQGQLSPHQELKWRTLQAIESLNQDPDVLYAEPNFIRKAAALPNDPQFNRQWNLSLIDLPAAWDLTQGQGVTIAVIDTGVDTDHADLFDNINFNDGYDFVSNVTSAGDGNGRDSDPFDLDPNNHGSHVAGIVAASGNNGIGITGVAYNATIMPLRALGANGEGSDADVAAAIYYAAGLPNSAGVLPDTRADIINLSLGSTDSSNTLQDAVNAAMDEGVIVVAAAGNNGADELFFPAAFDRVIAVSSVTDHKTLSTFSNYGSFIDVAAPGGTGHGDYLYDGFQDGILSTIYASEYAELVGTSMATPHVSGVVALMKAADNSLDLDQLLFGLGSGALTEDLGDAQKFGAGLINAAKALSWLGEDIPDQLNVFPPQLSFIGANDSATLTLSNPGSGSVSATMSASENWLELVPVPGRVGPSGLGRYQVNVNRASLPLTGSVTAFITVAWSIEGESRPDQRIDVFVSNSGASHDHVGQLYIYLLRKQEVDDAEDGDAIDVYATVNASYNTSTNRYSFTIVNVEAGEYYLEASTDNDGDYFVYDGGEAKGAYPLRSQPVSIAVSNQNISGLNFDVAYGSLTGSSAATTRRVNRPNAAVSSRRSN